MKRICIILAFLFIVVICSEAQTFKSGTYFHKSTDFDDFIIFSEDSICYRVQTSWGIGGQTMGLGTYKYSNERITIENSTDGIYQYLSSLSIAERNDTCCSFRIVDNEGVPISYCSIKILDYERDDNNEYSNDCKHGKRRINLIDKNKDLLFNTDEEGIAYSDFLSSYMDKHIKISCSTLGAVSVVTEFDVRRGCDYVLRIEVPMGFYVAKDGTSVLNIRPLSDGSLELKCKDPGDIDYNVIILNYFNDSSSIDLRYFQMCNWEIAREIQRDK